MVHEAAAYEAFQALGVPSPHTGFAFLRVNGESFGLHLNIETLDKLALEKRLGPFLSPPQHLYEGEYGADVTLAKFGELEVDEGKKKEKGDLEALVAAVANPTPSFSSAVAPVANLDEMARMWAAEKYSGQWDGYSGQTGEKQPNNYYLYSDASGSFQMLPWGTDETWGKHIGFEAPGGVLFNGCRGDGACKATYQQALTTALTTLNALGLDDAVRCAAARLQPWQLLEAAEKSSAHPERIALQRWADRVGRRVHSSTSSPTGLLSSRPLLEMSAPASPPPTLPCTDPASGPRCPPRRSDPPPRSSAAPPGSARSRFVCDAVSGGPPRCPPPPHGTRRR